MPADPGGHEARLKFYDSPAAQRAPALADRYQFKTEMDTQAWRAMFPYLQQLPA